MTPKLFAVAALKSIKSSQETHNKLYKLGVDLTNFKDHTDELEQAVALLTGGEKHYERALDMVQWWLYEDVDKVAEIDRVKYNLANPSEFVNWLLKWYKE